MVEKIKWHLSIRRKIKMAWVALQIERKNLAIMELEYGKHNTGIEIIRRELEIKEKILKPLL